MKSKWTKKIREAMLEDTDRILEQVNNDPNLKDVEAPEEIHEKLMKQVHDYEASKNPVDERLTAEEKELIQLGMVYKRTRKVYRYAIVAAAVVTMLSVGITSIGGPQKVVRIMREFVNSRDWLQIDVDKERIDKAGVTAENEAFLEIEKTFNMKAVSMYYLPQGLDFSQSYIDEKMQNAQLYYDDGKGKSLFYNIWIHYRPTSTGVDVEDKLLQDYVIDVNNCEVLVKQYHVEEGADFRWRAEFEYQKVHYFIVMNGLNQKEVEKIVKNLHFY